MDVVTLGMLIIDEIHFKPPREPEIDILGGAGSWAVVGARIFRPSPESRRVGWTVHKGSDFPTKVEDEINSWNMTCNFVDTPRRLTTRGWNKYGEDEERAFRYMTEKLRIDEAQLTEPLILSRCFHLICTPTRCISLVTGITERRRKVMEDHAHVNIPPIFVWEPVPDSMGPEAVEDLYRALKHVDVVSPNHQELAALFSVIESEAAPTCSMEQQCSMLIRDGFGDRDGAVVVRCGERGCYVASKKDTLAIPAYHVTTEAVTKVVDPTGAGNAFLGGLCIGMLDGQPSDTAALRNGAIYGSVAASFAVEQVGLPKLETTDDGRELWNGESVDKRLRSFKARLS